MANLGFSFNAADYKPLDGFTLTPKGEYNAILLNTEIDQSKPEKPCLVATFQITEGPEKGTELKENLFLWLPKDGSKSGGSGEISRRKMTSIVNAIGYQGQFSDTSILHGRPLTIKTDIRFSLKNDNSGDYIGFPDIKTFKTYLGPGNAAGADPVQPQAPAATAPMGNAMGAAPTFGGQTGFAMPSAPMGAFPAPAAPMGFPGAQAPVQAAPAAPAGFQMPQAPAAPAPAAFAPQGFAPMAPGGFPAQAAPAPFQPVPGAPSPFGAPGR
jgi:hypothetical protein